MEENTIAESSRRDFVLKDVTPSISYQNSLNSLIIKVPFSTEIEKISMEPYVVESSACRKDQEGDNLQFIRAEMDEVREENQRLKMCIDRIKRDSEILQTKIFSQLKDGMKSAETNKMDRETNESELVSLSLGSSPKNPKKPNSKSGEMELGLSVVLESNLFEASLKPSTSDGKYLEERKEVENAETWPPSKVSKTTRSRSSEEENEISITNPPKKARVSVRARCETPTMNDGCQWRKYGQKIAKGNPCPRAYYRCTGSLTCPVRKQVQRCAEDMRILTTTYEGNHNHHLPPSATAMASTTSAAASMLLSGSSSSSISNPYGLNFHLSDLTNHRPSLSSYPSSSSHPTITLDLTSSNPSSSSSSSLSFSQRNSSSLNFGSWRNGDYSNGYRTGTIDYAGKLLQDNIYQTLKNSFAIDAAPSAQQASPDALSAATKALTADPNFQTALKAALSLFIESDNSNGVGQRFKWQEEPLFSVTKPKEGGFSSNLLSKAPSI